MKKKILFSLILFLVFFEFLLRLSNLYSTQSEKIFGNFVNPFEQKFESHYKPFTSNNFKTTEFEYKHNYDELGFRNEPRSYKKAEILVFGDSFTEGLGAHQDSTWVRFLSKKLNKSIYNAAKIGSDPKFYLIEFKRLKKIIHPKSVIVLLNFSDIADFRFRHFKKNEQNINMFFYEHLHLYRFFTHFIQGKDYMFLTKKERSIVIRDITKHIVKTVYELKKLCVKEKIGLLVLVQPLPQQYYKVLDSRLDFNLIEKVVNQLIKHNITAYSLRNGLEKKIVNKEGWKKSSWIIDGHFNAVGYEKLSEVIFSKLKLKVNY